MMMLKHKAPRAQPDEAAKPMVHTNTLGHIWAVCLGWVWELGFTEPLAASGHCQAARAAAQQSIPGIKSKGTCKGESPAVLECSSHTIDTLCSFMASN